MLESPNPSQQTLGLSTTAHGHLRRLEAEGHFGSMVDAYRFAVALALAHGADAPPVSGSRQTIYNIGTLDRDGTLQYAVRALAVSDSDESAEKAIERLAEWGVTFLADLAEKRRGIPFGEIFDEVAERSHPTEDAEHLDGASDG